MVVIVTNHVGCFVVCCCHSQFSLTENVHINVMCSSSESFSSLCNATYNKNSLLKISKVVNLLLWKLKLSYWHFENVEPQVSESEVLRISDEKKVKPDW